MKENKMEMADYQKTIWKLEEDVKRLTAENLNLFHDLKLQRALNSGNHDLKIVIETLEKEVALTKEKNEKLREELFDAYRTIVHTLKPNRESRNETSAAY